jgi:hypothetical protein
VSLQNIGLQYNSQKSDLNHALFLYFVILVYQYINNYIIWWGLPVHPVKYQDHTLIEIRFLHPLNVAEFKLVLFPHKYDMS